MFHSTKNINLNKLQEILESKAGKPDSKQENDGESNEDQSLDKEEDDFITSLMED